MRYREGTVELGQPAQVDEGMLVGSAALGFFIGLLIFMAGRHRRVYWMIVWGLGLSLMSVLYIANGFVNVL